jgi:NAD(P)-dependent dehydrogenase (short-subunit alcohol dehydrogenase family)
VPDATWDAVLQTNLLAPLRLTRALAKQTLAAERTGSIINVISGFRVAGKQRTWPPSGTDDGAVRSEQGGALDAHALSRG